MSDNPIDIEITEDLMEKVALSQLYRDDPILTITKEYGKKLTHEQAKAVYKKVLRNDKFRQIKEDAIKLEAATLVDESTDTLLLYYNKLLKQAQFERKYEVVARILKEIQNLKSIENEESRFEVIIKLDSKSIEAYDALKQQENKK